MEKTKMSDKYILADDSHTPIPVDDVIQWADAFKKQDRHVAEDFIDDVKVSTVFLGLNHNFGGDGPPILWETMVFGGENSGWMGRYTSYDSALIGHKIVVELIKSGKSLEMTK
jgi:hypothetical protein